MSEGEGIKIMAPQVCTLGCVTSEAEAYELMLVAVLINWLLVFVESRGQQQPHGRHALGNV